VFVNDRQNKTRQSMCEKLGFSLMCRGKHNTGDREEKGEENQGNLWEYKGEM
jgi:hypothetical protein